MSKAHGYPPSLRLHLKREFDRVFQQGVKVVGPEALLWYLRRGDGAGVRLSVVVAAKLGTAVRRNRLKRLVRETFRLSRAHLAAGVDVVVYPRPGLCRWKGLPEAQRSLEQLWRKAGIWAG